jgi:hypothetical protein
MYHLTKYLPLKPASTCIRMVVMGQLHPELSVHTRQDFHEQLPENQNDSRVLSTMKS